MAAVGSEDGSRTRDTIGAALALALLLSLLAHLSTALLFVRFGGRAGAAGENGHGGAGDVTMDISVEGPRAERVQPAVAAAPQPRPTPPAPQSRPTPEVDNPPRTAPPAPPAPPVPLSPRERAGERAPTSAITLRDPTPDAPPPAPAAPTEPPVPLSPRERAGVRAAPALGTDSAATHGGRAAGAAAVRALILGSAGLMPTSVEGQRALLPAATTCEDPVAGVWRALKYSPQFGGQWVRFTLLIHRDANGDLTGSIRSRIWSGTPSDRSPPECAVGQLDTTHAMVARGRVVGEQLSFGSRSYRLVTDHCPQLFATSNGYAPDNFSGTVDSMRQEFQSVNNDGAYDINTPYVFRRVGCLAEREAPDAEDGE